MIAALVVIPTMLGLVAGFSIGFLTFKIKQRWCPTCGMSLSCPLGHSVLWWPSKTQDGQGARR